MSVFYTDPVGEPHALPDAEAFYMSKRDMIAWYGPRPAE